MKEMIRNQEKLAKLQAQVRIGGKETACRKKKVVHRTATAGDKKLQFSLKKLGVDNISGFEEVNMFANQGTGIHFNNPKVQASLAANVVTIPGHAETKQLTEMLPRILNQLGADHLTSLRRLAEALRKHSVDGKAPRAPGEEEEDEVPDLWRILMRLLRTRQTELRLLLKKVTLADITGAAILYHDCFLNFFFVYYGSDKI